MRKYQFISALMHLATVSGCMSAVPDDGVVDVEADKEALGIGAPIVHARFSTHYGGNIMEEDHYPTMGGPCKPGYERGVSGTAAPVVRWTGNGACEFNGWVNPGNPTDCTARLHVHTNAFWGGGTCDATTYQQRSTIYTCDARRKLCGGAGPVDPATSAPVCYCDNRCTTNGDCCPDYHLVCD